MFAPLKTWRRWHRKINLKQKRHAVASALAASAVAPLVIARGHRVHDVPELPLVVDSLTTDSTKALLRVLKQFGVDEELRRIRRSRKIRQGKGKMRNSRYTMRKGPLVIYGDENNKVKQAARNLPGIDVCHVSRLNLLQLAPGGHLGRFIIWTQEAFKQLTEIFGSYRVAGIQKKGYVLNRNVMTCADLAKIINSDQIQSVLRAQKPQNAKHDRKKNALKNRALMHRLNPHDRVRKELEQKLQQERHAKRAATLKAKRKEGKKAKAERRKTFNGIAEGLQASFKAAEDKIIAEDLALLGDQDDEEDDE
jgi:large subunit ribosomal protein L4e